MLNYPKEGDVILVQNISVKSDCRAYRVFKYYIRKLIRDRHVVPQTALCLHITLKRFIPKFAVAMPDCYAIPTTQHTRTQLKRSSFASPLIPVDAMSLHATHANASAIEGRMDVQHIGNVILLT